MRELDEGSIVRKGAQHRTRKLKASRQQARGACGESAVGEEARCAKELSSKLTVEGREGGWCKGEQRDVRRLVLGRRQICKLTASREIDRRARTCLCFLLIFRMNKTK